MPLTKWVALAILAAAAARTAPARAGVFSYIGGQLGIGAVEKVQPAIGKTLQDVDATLTKQEGQIQRTAGSLIEQVSGDVGRTLDKTDGILTQRLLQVQLGADQVVDNGVDKVNGAARQRITQIGGVLEASLVKVDDSVAKALDDVDGILKNRLGDVDKIVASTVDQADQAIAARIEQVDEIAGRRLGNVDVIASKQRLGLERTITRAAWLIGLVVFVIVVLKALWNEYLENEETIANEDPGPKRARRYVTVLWKPLARHLAVGAAAGLLLAFVPGKLPMAAAKEQQALVDYHAGQLAQSVAALDWTRVRFHASQLELMEPANAESYHLLEAKADLLRDLLGRRAALATSAGASAIRNRVLAVERVEAGRLDPDAATARAMILWQQGTTRRSEHEAATLAARALWVAPRGFTLSPMARLIVEAYLHAPDPATPDPTDGDVANSSGNLSTNAGLAAILATAPADPPGSPFEAEATLFHLMATLDATSSAAFVEMVEAQGQLSGRRPSGGETPLVDPKETRNKKAAQIVKAWETFDDRLRESPVLSDNPVVLGAFRLNDAVLSHALWFLTQPETTEWPPAIADIKGKTAKARKLAVAPARVAWTIRYARLLEGPARTLIEMQEAQRFEAYQQETLEFEGTYRRAPGTAVKPLVARNRRGKNPAPLAASIHPALRAATAAAALGLYQAGPAGQQPLALKIAASLAKLDERAKEDLAKGKASTDVVLSKLEATVNTKTDEVTKEAVAKLRALLEARGVQLI